MPLVIEWGAVHPCDALPECGVSVDRIEIGGPDEALADLLGVAAAPAGSAALAVWLSTPRGRVKLAAPDISS